MRFHYIEPSAWVKRYIDEPGTQWIGQLFTTGVAAVCSSIGVVEVLSAVVRRVPARSSSRARLMRRIRDDAEAMEVVDFTQMVRDRSMDIPSVYRLRGADAIHLASAMVYRDALDDDDELIVVSADDELLVAANLAGLPTIDPRTAR